MKKKQIMAVEMSDFLFIDGRDYSLEEITQIVRFVKNLAEMAEWEFTTEAQVIHSKAFSLVAKSRR